MRCHKTASNCPTDNLKYLPNQIYLHSKSKLCCKSFPTFSLCCKSVLQSVWSYSPKSKHFTWGCRACFRVIYSLCTQHVKVRLPLTDYLAALRVAWQMTIWSCEQRPGPRLACVCTSERSVFWQLAGERKKINLAETCWPQKKQSITGTQSNCPGFR